MCDCWGQSSVMTCVKNSQKLFRNKGGIKAICQTVQSNGDYYPVCTHPVFAAHAAETDP